MPSRFIRVYPNALDDALIETLLALPGAERCELEWRRCSLTRVKGAALTAFKRALRPLVADYRTLTPTLNFATELERPNVLRLRASRRRSARPLPRTRRRLERSDVHAADQHHRLPERRRPRRRDGIPDVWHHAASRARDGDDVPGVDRLHPSRAPTRVGPEGGDRVVASLRRRCTAPQRRPARRGLGTVLHRQDMPTRG